uniref:ABC1 domain-containing protein n=1 Tax=Rodentolepis nana TaxID=102285 RepID=A0A0R3U0D7_RODNA
LFRSFYIGIRISLMYKWTMLKFDENSENYSTVMNRCHQEAGDMILAGCLLNGGLFIKMGQGLTTMSHLIPTQITSTLEALHDKAIARSPNEVKRIFMKDFGSSPEELFEVFEEKPFAAASLAQVHRAVTKDGKEVAVKVQYEDLRDRFHSDIGTLEFLCRFVNFIHPKFKMAWILHDLKETLAQELDFEQEAANSERCRDDLISMGTLKPDGDVHVPAIEHKLSSKRVLTMEFIHGIKINDKESLRNAGFSLASIDKIMVTAFGRQIFCSGFVHADPHPGNLFVRRRPSPTSQSWLQRIYRFFVEYFLETPAQLVIIDHGLYQNISNEERLALCDMYRAILDNDEKSMQINAQRLHVSDYATFGEIIIQRPWRRIGRTLHSKLTEDDKAYIRMQAEMYFDRILDVLYEMPRSLLLTVRNLNMMRSICRSHDDQINHHEYLIYWAIIGGQIADQRVPYSGSVTKAWFKLEHYRLILRWEALKNWIQLLSVHCLALCGLASDLREIESVAIQSAKEKRMQLMGVSST